MDAFFAAVEQRDNPDLRGRPVIISGHSQRSVVSTASYEARKFGIHSAMPVFKAKKLCPHVVIVPGSMHKYKANSMKLMEILRSFSPVVEQVSIDEAYMDIKGCERLFGPPVQIAGAIKDAVSSNLSLTCSIGIAPVKFLAKIASDMKKPDGLTIIDKHKMPDFITWLPIEKVPGVGKKAMQQMSQLQIRTLGQLKDFPLSILKQKFGKMGSRLLDLANGRDTSCVETASERKSISSETTFSHDISSFDAVKQILLDRSQSVGRQLRKKNLVCKTVFIKLKFSDFSQITRSRTLDDTICTSTAIFDTAVKLYKTVSLKKKIRLAGVGVSGLKDRHDPVQMTLLESEPANTRQWESVDNAVDRISEKFGNRIVDKASLKQTPERR